MIKSRIRKILFCLFLQWFLLAVGKDVAFARCLKDCMAQKQRPQIVQNVRNRTQNISTNQDSFNQVQSPSVGRDVKNSVLGPMSVQIGHQGSITVEDVGQGSVIDNSIHSTIILGDMK